VPTPTYIPLATQTLTSTASTVTFSSIPATYRDLVLVMNLFTTADTVIAVRLNGDSGNNYSWVWMSGLNNNTAASGSNGGTSADLQWTLQNPLGANPKLITYNLMDYTATDKHKTSITRISDTGSASATAYASRWANTAAVNSITITRTAGGNYNTGSTFGLYGIAS
jgi:hypothetical protein